MMCVIYAVTIIVLYHYTINVFCKIFNIHNLKNNYLSGLCKYILVNLQIYFKTYSYTEYKIKLKLI